MTPDHPDAFLDYPPPREVPEDKVVCAQCKGHGGWNLRLNQYPLRGMEDTPENRHKFVHFRASCSNCVGWGFVPKEQGEHIHEWEYVRQIGNCLRLERCKTCGKEWEIDSSG